jgi:hypothetical protein
LLDTAYGLHIVLKYQMRNHKGIDRFTRHSASQPKATAIGIMIELPIQLRFTSSRHWDSPFFLISNLHVNVMQRRGKR